MREPVPPAAMIATTDPECAMENPFNRWVMSIPSAGPHCKPGYWVPVLSEERRSGRCWALPPPSTSSGKRPKIILPAVV